MAQQKTIAISASGDNIILDVSTISRVAVWEYVLVAQSAVTIIFKDEAATEYGRYTLTGPGIIAAAPVMGERFTGKGDLILNLSGSAIVTGHFCYTAKDAS